MTTADHSHPELEHILERQTALLEQQSAALDRHERILGRLVDFAEVTNATLHDMALTLERIEARLGSIEDALRGPGRN